MELERQTIKNLKTVLQTADLVKFARSTPEFGTTSKDRELVEGVVIETKEALPEPTPEEIREREEYRLLLAKKEEKTTAVEFGLLWGFGDIKFGCSHINLWLLSGKRYADGLPYH